MQADELVCRQCGWQKKPKLTPKFCIKCGSKLIGGQCQVCGFQKTYSKKFCKKCGKPLINGECLSCASKDRKIKYKFCMRCGTPLGPNGACPKCWGKIEGKKAQTKVKLEATSEEGPISRKIDEKTERELKVVVKKEHCIVCDGVIVGASYICRCMTKYCFRCAQVLAEREEECWACKQPIEFPK